MAPWIVPVCLAAALCLLVAIFLRGWTCCRARHRALAPLAATDTIHEEDSAGYSHRNLVSKIGASRSVKLIVTRDSLVVDLALPLGLIAKQVDMCHRINFSAIDHVQARQAPFGTECVISYRTPAGEPRRLSLFPESPDRVLKALPRDRIAVV